MGASTLKKLGEVLEFKNGKSIKPGGVGAYPVYGSNGIIGGCDDYKEQNGIIIGRVGAYCGSVSLYPGKFWASDNTIVAYPKNMNYDLVFLSYLLGELNLNRWAGGAAQPLLTQTVLKQVEAPIPLRLTQIKIAAILSAYDDLIENNLRRINILEEMAQNLYREWFANFRFPGHEQARFVDSPLGKIPEGWEVKKLKHVLELKYGKALKKSDRNEGNVPVFGSSGIVGYHDKPLVQGPGIVVGRKGNVGSIFWSDISFYPIDTVYFVETDLPLRYLYYDLQSKNFINNDAAVPGLNRNQAYSLETLVPSKDVLNSFCRVADQLEGQALLLKKKSQSLRQTRDLLLPKLISGEIDVSELDIKAPEEVAS